VLEVDEGRELAPLLELWPAPPKGCGAPDDDDDESATASHLFRVVWSTGHPSAAAPAGTGG
jgi:hypothetical protein